MHQLAFYPDDELEIIVRRTADVLKVAMDAAGAHEIAKRSRGTPRVANRLLRRVRDYAQVRANGRITLEVAQAALLLLDVDHFGLDDMDSRLLRAIIEKFDGGPVGLGTIAAAIGEDAGTIEEVYEPYLVQNGFLQRTPRGRVATRTRIVTSGSSRRRARRNNRPCSSVSTLTVSIARAPRALAPCNGARPLLMLAGAVASFAASGTARAQSPDRSVAFLADSIAANGDTVRASALLDSALRRDNKDDGAAWHQFGLLNWNMARSKRNGSYMSDQRAIRLLRGADTALRLATKFAPDSARTG